MKEKQRTAIDRRNYCRKFCTASLGWNDQKRIDCRLKTPCQEYTRFLAGDMSENELLDVCKKLLGVCEVLDEADCPTKLLAMTRTAIHAAEKKEE